MSDNKEKKTIAIRSELRAQCGAAQKLLMDAQMKAWENSEFIEIETVQKLDKLIHELHGNLNRIHSLLQEPSE